MGRIVRERGACSRSRTTSPSRFREVKTMRILWGNGDIESEERFETDFSSIGVSGSCKLRLHRGDYKIEVTSDSNLLPYINTRISGGTLYLGFKPFTWVVRKTELEFNVTLPELSRIGSSGSTEVEVDAFSGDVFSAFLSGSGEVKADTLDYESISLGSSGSGGFGAIVQAHDFKLHSSGSGATSIMGAAKNAEISLSGSADIDGRNFAAEEARINSSGSSLVELRVVKKLDAHISGSGDVRYWGDPAVSRHVSGSGRVQRSGD